MYGHFEYSGPQALEGIAGLGMGLVLGVASFVLLLTLGLSIAVYIFQSLSCYTIAKRRGIHNPWLAWIPVGNMWILGSISDQYQYVKKGKTRNRRKVLLWLTVAMYVMMLPSLITQIGMIVQTVTGVDVDVMSSAILMGIFSLALTGVTLVAAVFQYIAYYDLFASCQPENSVMYLVLSILFNITLPVFLFVCRNKDEGMPPRKQAAPAQPQPEVVVDAQFVEASAEDDEIPQETDEVIEADFEE